MSAKLSPFHCKPTEKYLPLSALFFSSCVTLRIRGNQNIHVKIQNCTQSLQRGVRGLICGPSCWEVTAPTAEPCGARGRTSANVVVNRVLAHCAKAIWQVFGDRTCSPAASNMAGSQAPRISENWCPFDACCYADSGATSVTPSAITVPFQPMIDGFSSPIVLVVKANHCSPCVWFCWTSRPV